MENGRNKKKLFMNAFFTILGVLLLVVIGGTSAYMLWEKAPDVEPEAPAASQEESVESSVQPTGGNRQQDVYTVLLVGQDDGNGNTDTILVGRVDTTNHKMDFVSIPRDTLVNLDWNVRKINAVYSGTANSGGVAIEGLKQQIKNLLGFGIDCYAVVDLDVFIDTVDLLGGVDFEVPQAMHYEDPAQNLYIHLDAGYQHLNGQQAMGLVRYRSGYINGDLGRVETQQKFLKAAASQFISLGNIPNISEVVDLLAKNLETDMSAANIAFFLRQALLCSSEDINFHTMPNTPDMVYGLSYTFVELEPWLEMVNSCLNPYNTAVTAANVDIVYKQDGVISATSGELKGAWYYSAMPVSAGTTLQPEMSILPEESPAPAPETTPVPEESPETSYPPSPEASPETTPEASTEHAPEDSAATEEDIVILP